MDKLRACIVANYYASAGLLKVSEVSIHSPVFSKPPFFFSGGEVNQASVDSLPLRHFLHRPIEFNKPACLSEEHRSSGIVLAVILPFPY